MTHMESPSQAPAWAGANRRALAPLATAMVLSVLAIALTLTLRGPVPIDETRYLTVAWEMWRSGDLLVPHLNGEPYSHKPPMLFWLINAAWAITGPQEMVARLVPALFLPLSVFMTYRLGAELGGRTVGGRAALVLATISIFAVMCAATMFDAMLTVATLGGLLGVVSVARGTSLKGWLIFGASLSFGILSKGPVVLIHILPAALFAPLWAPVPLRWSRWYLCLLAAVVGGAALPLAWAISAAIAGGSEFGALLLWGQTSGRVVNAFTHKRPFWFYIVLIPVLVFPWGLSAHLWTRAGWQGFWQDRLWRLPIIMAAGTFVIMSAVSSKQIHYLLPILPAVALLMARKIGDASEALEERAFPIIAAFVGVGLLSTLVLTQLVPVPALPPAPGILLLAGVVPLWWLRRSPWTVIPAASVLLLVALMLQGGLGALAPFDLRPLASRVDPAAPAAFVNRYQGEIGFASRRTEPVETVAAGDAAEWRKAHRDGYLIAKYKKDQPDFGAGPVFSQPYQQGQLGLWAPLGPE